MKLFNKGLIPGLIAIFMFLSSYTTVAAAPITTDDATTFFDELVQEKMASSQLPNLTLSVVADGEIILAKSYGFANFSEQRQVDPATTLFRVGSISKLFTWTAVMQLVEQGKLDLDTDVNAYLDFEIPSQLEITSGASEAEAITLTHLMTHTPGFEDNSETLFRLSQTEALSLHEYVRSDLPARVFPAGEVIAYSNYGSALAGYIVEQVSGIPFEEYVQQHIFTPLGMEHSTFRQPLPEDLSSNMAQAYRYVDGEFLPGAFEFMPSPAGGLSSSAEDMAQFMLAHLQGRRLHDARILEEDTVRQMQGGQFTHHPSLQGISYGFMERQFNDRRVLLHPGSTMIFDSGLYLLPEENTGLFISYSGGDYRTHTEIFEAFMDRYFPASSPVSSSVGSEHAPSIEMAKRSKEFTGEYYQNRKSFTTSEKFISLVSGLIHVESDEEGYLQVTHLGENYTFVETEPGIYYNLAQENVIDPLGSFSTIVFESDPLARTLLLTDGPMSYSRAPWYSTSSFTFPTLIISLLLIIGSFVYWMVKAGARSIRNRFLSQRHSDQQVDQKKNTVKLISRFAAALYSVLTIGFVVGLVVTSEVDPVYGLPKAYYGAIPAWTSVLDYFPLLMAVVGSLLGLITILIWRKKVWRVVGRIHYSLFTAAALMMLWIFAYWNLFLL